MALAKKTVRADTDATVLIPVVEGETYQFTATGKWVDWYVTTDADGYNARFAALFGLQTQLPGAPFLALCGHLSGAANTSDFFIGRQRIWTATDTGTLSVYANDLTLHPWFRDNNRGEIVVTVDNAPLPEEPVAPRGVWRQLVHIFTRTEGIAAIAALVILPLFLLAALPIGRDIVIQTVESVATDGSAACAGWGPAPWMTAAVLCLGLQAWFWPRRIIEANFSTRRDTWSNIRPLLIWSPRLLGILPFLVVFLIVGLAVPRDTGTLRNLVLWGTGVSGVLFTAFVLGREKLTAWLRGRWSQSLAILGIVWPAIGILLSFVLFCAICVDPAGVGQALGPAAIVLLAVCGIIPAVAIIAQIASVYRFPALAALLVMAIAFSPLNDRNHAVGRRALPLSHPAAPLLADDPRDTLDNAYLRWLSQANTVSDPAGDYKPMIIIAAEGGASRAGFWTGQALAALQAQNPKYIPANVFAISSISGGSVGALGWIRSQTSGGKRADLLDDFTGADHLGPAFAANLFPDAVQRFLPFPVLPDGAEGLEKSFEASWMDACARQGCAKGTPGLDTSFLSLWAPARNATWLPLLFVGGANEETGRRILTAPVSFGDAIDADDYFGDARRDIWQSTAITNGARFPWISPPGLVAGASGNHHIVDGGYFDASGIETARELAVWAQKKAAVAGDPVRPLIVYIGYRETARELPQPSPAFANDALGPLLGLYAARLGHMKHMTAIITDTPLKPADTPPPGPVTPATQNSGGVTGKTGNAQEADDLREIRALAVTLHTDADRPLPMDWVLSHRVRAYARGLIADCGQTRSDLEAVAALLGDAPPPGADTCPPPSWKAAAIQGGAAQLSESAAASAAAGTPAATAHRPLQTPPGKAGATQAPGRNPGASGRHPATAPHVAKRPAATGHHHHPINPVRGHARG